MEENSENEIKLLLGGVIPEREAEMRDYLNKYAPHFARCNDRPGFVVEAGPFGLLNFTQRTMHQMWILGFAANQALHSFSSTIFLSNGELDTTKLDRIPDQATKENKYLHLIDSVYRLADVNNTKDYLWPSDVPEPEGGKPKDVDGAVTFDLICMSGAYVFLHEMKHIAFRNDGNTPLNPHQEELECDQFAKQMMLGELELYSKQSGYDLLELTSKRIMSISLAHFFMLVITKKDLWTGSKTHPSFKSRMTSMVSGLTVQDNDISWRYMSCLFLSHLRYLKIHPLIIKFNNLKELTIGLISEIESASKS